MVILQCNPSDSGEILHILIDAVAKTTTCIGSQIGVNFLHHNVHKSDVTENTTIKCLLSQFLAGNSIFFRFIKSICMIYYFREEVQK